MIALNFRWPTPSTVLKMVTPPIFHSPLPILLYDQSLNKFVMLSWAEKTESVISASIIYAWYLHVYLWQLQIEKEI
jgi:hypothetical protein